MIVASTMLHLALPVTAITAVVLLHIVLNLVTAWRLRRPDVTLYNTQGEVKYGLTYDDAQGKSIGLAEVGPWLTAARLKGPVGVVMRVKSSDESHEMDMLPKDAKRYDEGNMVILIFPQSAP